LTYVANLLCRLLQKEKGVKGRHSEKVKGNRGVREWGAKRKASSISQRRGGGGEKWGIGESSFTKKGAFSRDKASVPTPGKKKEAPSMKTVGSANTGEETPNSIGPSM